MLDYGFTKELENLINRNCIENGSNTPDFMLAEYLIRCIDNYNQICRQRDAWYSVHLCPGNSHFEKKDKERPQDIMEGGLLRTTQAAQNFCLSLDEILSIINRGEWAQAESMLRELRQKLRAGAR